MKNSTHDVEGARAEVELTVDVSIERFWSLVTDLSRIGEWSPETTYAAWLDGGGPAPGARFEAHNEFPNGLRTRVLCVVTAAQEPHTFGWDVRADDADVDSEAPQSSRRYDLSPAPAVADGERTKVRQTFVHGAAETGLSMAVRDDPANAPAQPESRLKQLRDNMTATITAMAGAARG